MSSPPRPSCFVDPISPDCLRLEFGVIELRFTKSKHSDLHAFRFTVPVYTGTVKRKGRKSENKWNKRILCVAIKSLICYNDAVHIPQDGKEKNYGKEIV